MTWTTLYVNRFYFKIDFQAKERIVAKKQSTKARFSRGKKLPKKRDRVHNPRHNPDKKWSFITLIFRE